MIYRNNSNVLYWWDYRLAAPSKYLFPNGTFQNVGSGYVLQQLDGTVELTEQAQVIGLKLTEGSFEILGTSSLLEVTTPGEWLVVYEPSDNTIRMYLNTDNGQSNGTLQATESVIGTPAVTLRAKAKINYALQSTSGTVLFRNLGSLRLFLGNTEIQTVDGVCALNSTLAVDNRLLTLKTSSGAEIEYFTSGFMAGDVFQYVAPDWSSFREGQRYRYSPPTDSLYQRFQDIDGALIQGGMLRTSPMPPSLELPQSSTYIEMVTMEYTLDDVWKSTQDNRVWMRYEGCTDGVRVVIGLGDKTASNQQATLQFGQELHVTARSYGLALLTNNTVNDAYGLALERDTTSGTLTLYTVGHNSPRGNFRTSTDPHSWYAVSLPYVIPGESTLSPGPNLRQTQHSIRKSAGPYLFDLGMLRHCELLVLMAAGDAPSGGFQVLARNGTLHRYASVGHATFDSRFGLLIQAD